MARGKKGLFAGDELWKCTLRDSFRSGFLPQFKLFAVILATCSPSNPDTLCAVHGSQFVSNIQNTPRQALPEYFKMRRLLKVTFYKKFKNA